MGNHLDENASFARPVRLGRSASTALALLACAVSANAQTAAEAINVYTTRERQHIAPLLATFESLTRIKTNVVYLSGDPVARLTADRAAGKVDIFIAAELSHLVAAKSAGLTEAVTNANLTGRVPAKFLDLDGHWLGLTRRVRVVAASRERVSQQAFTYEELADPKWKGKLCMRSGLHPYNVLLTASMIAHKGEPVAEAWLRGLKANLAGKPSGGDRDQILAVVAGRCDIALVNSYYVGGMRAAKDKPETQIAGNAVNVIFPNAGDRGAHVSISGLAMMKGAPGLDSAALLADFLTSEPAQFVYAQDSFEYPVREDVKPSGLVESWGTPKLDAIPLGDLTSLQAKAAQLIGKVGFDAGPGS